MHAWVLPAVGISIILHGFLSALLLDAMLLEDKSWPQAVSVISMSDE